MIEGKTFCYLFKSTKDNSKRIYHRSIPNNKAEGSSRWNTPIKEEAGYLTKTQWQQRSSKWTFDQGWLLESINGEVEAL